MANQNQSVDINNSNDRTYINQTSILGQNNAINVSGIDSRRFRGENFTDHPPEYSELYPIDNGNLTSRTPDEPKLPTYEDVIQMNSESRMVSSNRCIHLLENNQNISPITGHLNNNISCETCNFNEGMLSNYQDPLQFSAYQRRRTLENFSNSNRSTEIRDGNNKTQFMMLYINWILVMIILKMFFLVWIYYNILFYDPITYGSLGFLVNFIVIFSLILENLSLNNLEKETADLSLSYSKRFWLLLFNIKRIFEIFGLTFVSYKTIIPL